jgi:hypothetical protein
MQYFVHFIAHINERTRPDGFPREIYVDETYEVENDEHLKHLVNKRFIQLVSSMGLVVMKDYDETIDMNTLSFDKRIFVPWQMVTFFEVAVTYITPPPTKTQDPITPVPEPAPPPPPKESISVN